MSGRSAGCSATREQFKRAISGYLNATTYRMIARTTCKSIRFNQTPYALEM